MASNIALQDFNRFLAAKAPEKPCPECSTNHWLAQGVKLPSGETEMLPVLGIGMNLGSVPTYVMFCANCGFAKSFRAETIDNWVDDNG